MTDRGDTRFQEYYASPTPPVYDDKKNLIYGEPEYAPVHVIKARVSDGSETVNGRTGPQNVGKGDVVVVIEDMPGVYDVIPANTWNKEEVGWKLKGDDKQEAPQRTRR